MRFRRVRGQSGGGEFAQFSVEQLANLANALNATREPDASRSLLTRSSTPLAQAARVSSTGFAADVVIDCGDITFACTQRFTLTRRGRFTLGAARSFGRATSFDDAFNCKMRNA